MCNAHPSAQRLECTRRGKWKRAANPFTARVLAQRRSAGMPAEVRRDLCAAYERYVTELPRHSVQDVELWAQRQGQDIIVAHASKQLTPQDTLDTVMLMVEMAEEGTSMHLLCHCHPAQCHCMILRAEIQRRVIERQP